MLVLAVLFQVLPTKPKTMPIVDLYHRYLRGELSEDELTSFKESVDNASDDELWQMMEDETLHVENVRMSAEIREEILRNIHKKIRLRRLFSTFLKCAATILVLTVCATVYLWYHQSSLNAAQPMSEVIVAPGDKASIVLPDGTKVTMNSSTIIHYAVEKHGRRDVVIKSGEAYFDVAKDRDHPFHVTVGDMQIEVLGTTFNVNAYGPQVATSLFSGSVKLTAAHLKDAYMLKPSEKSVYETANHSISIKEADMDEDAGWKNGYLIFNSLSLQEVLTKIERWYGVKIKLENPKYADDKLTGSFRNETLESVLNSLSIQYKFTYQTQEDLIIVK